MKQAPSFALRSAPSSASFSRRDFLRAAAGVTGLLLLGACGQGGQAQAPGGETVAPHLGAALSFVPPPTQSLAYTDWEAIKLRHAAGSLTSASPLEERRNFFAGINESEVGASAFALKSLGAQAELWGWDTTDLLWEATVQGEGAPAFVLRLRDDFDMEALPARFEERGFTKTEHAGVLVYTHLLDPTVEWLTDPAILSAAVLPDEKILIHAFVTDPILDVLDAHAGGAAGANWQGDAGALAVAGALGSASAAMIAPGAQLCTEFGFAALEAEILRGAHPTEDELAAVKSKYFGDAPLHPYTMLGIGYRYEDQTPVSTVVMHYASQAEAEADLAARQQLAATGQSIVTEASIAELLFTPAAKVQGDNIVVEGRPVDDRPQRLFQMFSRRDLPFAACS